MSFEPSSYDFVATLRRPSGRSEFLDSSTRVYFRGQTQCPSLELRQIMVANSDQQLDPAMWEFGPSHLVDAHEAGLFLVELRFKGREFSDGLDARAKECQKTQNTLRALILGSRVHLSIRVNGEQTHPLFLQLDHRLEPIC